MKTWEKILIVNAVAITVIIGFYLYMAKMNPGPPHQGLQIPSTLPYFMTLATLDSVMATIIIWVTAFTLKKKGIKKWHKILTITIIITLVIMSFFTSIGLLGLHVQVMEFDHYEKYSKLQNTYGLYHERSWDLENGDMNYPIKTYTLGIAVYLHFNIVQSNPDYPISYDGLPQGRVPEQYWFEYVEVYAKAKNNTYILMDNRSRNDNPMYGGYESDYRFYVLKSYRNITAISYEELTVNNPYREIPLNKTDCPLIATNQHEEEFESGVVVKYDSDVYAIAYFNKPIYVKHDYIAYNYMRDQIYSGLHYSAIAFVIVWIIAFIVWVVAHHIIGFVEWLKT